MQASFPASFHADCVCVKSKCASSLGFGLSKQPGDSTTAKLSLGGLLFGGCVGLFCFCLLFQVLLLEGFLLRMAQARSDSHPCRNTSAGLQSGPLTAAV